MSLVKIRTSRRLVVCSTAVYVHKQPWQGVQRYYFYCFSPLTRRDDWTRTMLKHLDFFFRNKIDAVFSFPGIIHTQKDSKMPLAVKEDASIVSLGTIYQTMQQR